MKYKVLGATADANGVVEIPDGDEDNIIGVLYHPITGELTIALLQELVEPKADVKEEPKGDKLVNLPAKEKTPDGK